MLWFMALPRRERLGPSRKREPSMRKVIECRSVVPGCDFVAHGASDQEAMMHAVEHLRIAHDVDHLSEPLRVKLRAAITNLDEKK